MAKKPPDGMTRRDRQLAGELHPRAVLTDRDVELMRELWESRACTQPELARQFEVSRSMVWKVVNYRRRNT
jgi:DNA-binding CsgD family transcriptional regulator